MVFNSGCYVSGGTTTKVIKFKEADLKSIGELVKKVPLYELESLDSYEIVIFDLENIKFAQGYCLLFLIYYIKRYYEQTGKQVVLRNISCSEEEPVYSYLERIDFFKIAGEWVDLEKVYKEALKFDRASHSFSVMEICALTKSSDYSEIGDIEEQVKRCIDNILDGDEMVKSRFKNVFREFVDNICNWSESDGFTFIQKYSYGTYITLVDNGIGIYRSLEKKKKNRDTAEEIVRYIESFESEPDYFEAAVKGQVTRSGNGGFRGIMELLKDDNNGSKIRAISGNYRYDFDKSSNIDKIEQIPFNYSGTFINILFKNRQ